MVEGYMSVRSCSPCCAGTAPEPLLLLYYKHPSLKCCFSALSTYNGGNSEEMQGPNRVTICKEEEPEVKEGIYFDFCMRHNWQVLGARGLPGCPVWEAAMTCPVRGIAGSSLI